MRRIPIMRENDKVVCHGEGLDLLYRRRVSLQLTHLVSKAPPELCGS